MQQFQLGSWFRYLLLLVIRSALPRVLGHASLTPSTNLSTFFTLVHGDFDQQIIDRAWALIIDKHPELGAYHADDARAQGDIVLKRSCPPSTRVRCPHPIMSSSRANRGAPGASTWQIADSQGMDTSSSNQEVTTVKAKDNESCGEGRIKGLNKRNGYLGAGSIRAIEWDQYCEVRPQGANCVRMISPGNHLPNPCSLRNVGLSI